MLLIQTTARVFKTKKFSKAASKALLSDCELCSSIKEVMAGQVVDLGGGVYKKRLNENRYRSIILTKVSEFWVYEFLFAKNERDNITDAELHVFRSLVSGYRGLTATQLESLIKEAYLLEICHDQEK